MKYKGWNFEKTLLIRSDSRFDRPNELIDVRIAVETSNAASIPRDVRVVAKPAWNRVGDELPSQVYDIKKSGGVTTFRVAFRADIPACSTQRIGVLYDNPDAPSPVYQSDMTFSSEDGAFTAENRYYRMHTDAASGQLTAIFVKMRALEYVHFKRLTKPDASQPGVRVIFADPSKPSESQSASAADWRQPETTVVQGPVFASVTRRGRLTPAGQRADGGDPSLEITYRFIADQPYMLVHSRLEFHKDTPVFGIHNDMLAVDQSCFSHYGFRPVSPSLPDTDVEEIGHVLVAPQFTEGMPDGMMFGGFLPYGLAWHSFISTIQKLDYRFDYALTGIRLHEESRAASGPAPMYRAATYLHRHGNSLTWFRAPVYVKKQNCRENMITIPVGTTYAETYALHFGEWDNKQRWLRNVDELGRRLNQPLVITQHPHFPEEPAQAEAPPGILLRSFAGAYTKAGVR